MGAFSTLLKRSKAPTRESEPSNGQSNGSAMAGSDTTSEKVQRRQSKREFFRNLLSKSGPRSNSRASHKESNQIKSTTLRTPSKDSPVHPTSPMSDSNKPLPPAPAPGSQQQEPPSKPPTQLNRIISPIALPDLHKLFSGAPQFFARSEGHHSGAPHPSVAFPWNIELEIRDLSDHGQIEDQAWGYVTCTPHITRDVNKSSQAAKEHMTKQRARFAPRLHERPDMLSMEGLERGTIGFQAAMQLGVSDVLQEDLRKPIDQDALTRKRLNFLEDKKHGLRMLDEASVIARLTELGDMYQKALFQGRSTVEMYSELFTQILFPPTRVTDSEDPYSLHVQIEALLEVLAAPSVWIDFSLVEWRIRLGQIIWGPATDPDIEDGLSINGEEVREAGSQKFWLLLQILLSCELLIRIDTITFNAEHKRKAISVEETHRFEGEGTTSMKWSLLLARLWLDNVRIETTKPETSTNDKATGGWLAAFTGVASGSSTVASLSTTEFRGRNEQRQAAGLIHFARNLDWPQLDQLAAKFVVGASFESNSSTPTAGTPLSMSTQRSSYFGNSSRRPAFRRTLSRQNTMSAMIHPSGWLSRSYLTGLILPGEGLSHFLISTLLENDATAVAQLGEEANLYGGFMYAGKSFWSTACIIGRVLAAGKGASECMGWLSSEKLPNGVSGGWVNVEVEMAPQDVNNSPDTARIWNKKAVERDSHVLGDGDASSILPGDFTLPVSDPESSVVLKVKFESLDLFTSAESVLASPTEESPTPITNASENVDIRTYSATTRFTVSADNSESREMNMALNYDVHFVTAHPCVPSKHTDLLHTSTSPSFGTNSVQLEGKPRGSTAAHDLFAGHPLHKSFNYTRHHFSTLLLPTVSSSGIDPLASLHTPSSEIFVIDCTEVTPPALTSSHQSHHVVSTIYVPRKRRFGSDLEMLARAWCAEKGLNALISRRGRNCIACSIREARALGWKIVLRFG